MTQIAEIFGAAKIDGRVASIFHCLHSARVCFYLKLTLRISRFRIIVTHQGKAEDNNNLLYSEYSYRPASTNNIEPLFHSIVRPDWSVALHL